MTPSEDQSVLLTLTAAGDRLERRLTGALSHIKGISFAEYRLLRALADAADQRMSRVDLAGRVGLTPSGVTRALQPLEKLGFVETIRGERDARLALAHLTSAGEELVSDASGILDDVAARLFESAPRASKQRGELAELLVDLVGVEQ